MRNYEHTFWEITPISWETGYGVSGFKQDHVSLLQHLLPFCLQNLREQFTKQLHHILGLIQK